MMTLMPKTITMELLGVVVVLCGSGKHLEGPRWLTAIGQQGDDVQEYCKDKGNSGYNANHLRQWNKVRCSVSSWRAIRCYLTYPRKRNAMEVIHAECKVLERQ